MCGLSVVRTLDTQSCFRDLDDIASDYNIEKRALHGANKFEPTYPRRCLGHTDVTVSKSHSCIALATAFYGLAIGSRYLGLAENIIGSTANEVLAFDGYYRIGLNACLDTPGTRGGDRRLVCADRRRGLNVSVACRPLVMRLALAARM